MNNKFFKAIIDHEHEIDQGKSSIYTVRILTLLYNLSKQLLSFHAISALNFCNHCKTSIWTKYIDNMEEINQFTLIKHFYNCDELQIYEERILYGVGNLMIALLKNCTKEIINCSMFSINHEKFRWQKCLFLTVT